MLVKALSHLWDDIENIQMLRLEPVVGTGSNVPGGNAMGISWSFINLQIPAGFGSMRIVLGRDMNL